MTTTSPMISRSRKTTKQHFVLLNYISIFLYLFDDDLQFVIILLNSFVHLACSLVLIDDSFVDFVLFFVDVFNSCSNVSNAYDDFIQNRIHLYVFFLVGLHCLLFLLVNLIQQVLRPSIVLMIDIGIGCIDLSQNFIKENIRLAFMSVSVIG